MATTNHTGIENLPCPRLELEWVQLDGTWNRKACVYSLVLPLGEYDIRRQDKDGNKVRNEKKVEMGRMESMGNRIKPPIYEDGLVETPYRDGSHALWDSVALGGHIPVVAVCGNNYSILGTTEDSK